MNPPPPAPRRPLGQTVSTSCEILINNILNLALQITYKRNVCFGLLLTSIRKYTLCFQKCIKIVKNEEKQKSDYPLKHNVLKRHNTVLIKVKSTGHKRKRQNGLLTQHRWAPAWCQEEDWWGRRTMCSGGRSSHLEKETQETFRASPEPSLVLLHYTVHQSGNEPSNHWKYEPPSFSTSQRGQRQSNPRTVSGRMERKVWDKWLWGRSFSSLALN